MLIKHLSNMTVHSQLFLLSLTLLCTLGIAMQYSAGGGSWYPYAISYIIKMIIAFIVLFIICKIDLKIIFILTDLFYFSALGLLLLVDIIGIIRLGAQRWIDFGIFVLQPSEIMKIAVTLMLAKHFHKMSLSQVGKLRFYLFPIFISVAPFLLVFLQPDLGTSIIILSIAFSIFYLSGFKASYILAMVFTGICAMPIIWSFLYDYQKARILTFLDPERDPLGAGYHIIQSKIAIGSGGIFGKGFLSSTQGRLDFLPEKQTDFIFTLLSEEFGFVGGFFLILIYSIIIILGYKIAKNCDHRFGQLVVIGCTTMIFIHIFVNIGMVSGLLPVVGVPLPFISFGGTSMITNMIAFGLILNIDNNKNYA